MKCLFSALSAAAAVLLSGCIHFDYTGEEAPETGVKAQVFRENACNWSETDSRVLGQAVIWGDYQDVSRDELLDRLAEEAESRGANVVRITEEQVVPDEEEVSLGHSGQNSGKNAPSGDDTSLAQMQSDFGGGYGKAELFGKNKPQKDDNASTIIRDYKRIIRADFLQSKKPPKKPAVKPRTPAADDLASRPKIRGSAPIVPSPREAVATTVSEETDLQVPGSPEK